MTKKYTVEKTLYFADREEGLHVCFSEPSYSDLTANVRLLVQGKYIIRAAEDDSGSYYRITKRGKIKLLRLQIEWRRARNKDITSHSQKLEALLNESS